MAVYMAFLTVQSPQNLFWVYPLKTVSVAVVLWVFRKRYEELRSPMCCAVIRRSPMTDPVAGDLRSAEVRGQETGAQHAAKSWLLAILVGLVAIAIWIGIDPFYPKFGKAEVFDPGARWGFIGFRVAGAVLVVPLMEELFWRAFLIRWLVNEDFKRVPVGIFTWPSFAITVALFGAEHQEWLAGLICGAMYNWLFYKRKDVFSCVVAHAVSNAALAAWVVARGDWKFW
jgi:CAAX prenyl protease-like protein